MTNEVTIKDEASNLVSAIERMATNPDVDVVKLEKMLDMQERVINRLSMQQFSADMALMQPNLPTVAEKGKGHNDKKYALLEDINAAVRPVLALHGFA